ncbi:MFS transporter [Catenuloplanes indicus]|uniref:MFS family permease n=1 Tax=Catenuloplanes indicus TaxID=137267 RepID=A0AAE3VTQ9_9ACTN|nr:MFS transporter [Catenuloplanes indicus]MDQ0363504.1 MFS family permease [Catenuloplanes indicus]
MTTISTRPPATAARATVLASASLTIMGAAIIAPGLPAMTAAYAGTQAAEVLVRLTLTVTSLAIAVTAPAAGLLADRVGRRPLLIASLALYAAAALILPAAALFLGEPARRTGAVHGSPHRGDRREPGDHRGVRPGGRRHGHLLHGPPRSCRSGSPRSAPARP